MGHHNRPSALGGKLLPELQQIAQTLGVEGAQKLRKAGLIDAIVEKGGDDGSVRQRRRRPRPRRLRRRLRESDDRWSGVAHRREDARRHRDGRRGTSVAAAPLPRRRRGWTLDRGDRATRPTVAIGGGHDRDRGPTAATAGADGGDAQRSAASPLPRGSSPAARGASASARRPSAPRRSRTPRRRGHPRRAARGLRVPPDLGATCRVPTTSTSHVGQVRKHPLRKGDVVSRQGPPRPRQREVRGAARRRHGQRRRSRAGRAASAVRQAHTAVPRRAVPARERPDGGERADHRHGRADRQGPARHGRVAAQGRQDDDPQADRERHHQFAPGHARDGAARGRASRRGHRLAADRSRPPRSCTRPSTSPPTSTSR